MKILVEVTIDYDNEIRFFDACKAAAEELERLGKQALETGDAEQFIGQIFEVTEPQDDEQIGTIKIEAR